MELGPVFGSPSSLPHTPTDEQLLAYIAQMCTELRSLARRPKFKTVNYLLDMARLEAERASKDPIG